MERPRRAAARKALERLESYSNVRKKENVAKESEEENKESDWEDVPEENIEEIDEMDDPDDSPGDDGAGDRVVHIPKRFKTYGDEDDMPRVPPFKPSRPPGPHIPETSTRADASKYTTALDFFRLFFSVSVIEMIRDNSNKYGQMHILEKSTYANADGMWEDITTDEVLRFIGIVLFMGIVKLPDLPRYYSHATLYAGGWARRFLARKRVKAVMAMLHVCDPATENKEDKLTKVRVIVEHMKKCCQLYYQPDIDLSIDERMIRSKGRTPITQYMPNKPARFGVKLWCLCDSNNGYTVDFNVYTGKRQKPSINGLAYDVCTELLTGYQNQGYHVFCDNFFTSLSLVGALKKVGVMMCGTTLPHRRGFPLELKNKSWAKKAERGSMRFMRKNGILCLQWKDRKPVCVLSSFHTGKDHVMVQRRGKGKDGSFERLNLMKPVAIDEYNKKMGGVDLSDQLIQAYNILLKSHRWWKTIFYHLVDVATVNSYILFRQWQRLHPELDALKRGKSYSQLHFREELMRQLAQITDDEDIPVGNNVAKITPASSYHVTHYPEHAGVRRNCRVCYIQMQKEVKSILKCGHPDCGVHLCINAKKNCFHIWHSPRFDEERSKPYTICHY